MKAKWNNTWLADSVVTRMSGLAVNGRQIVQEVPFLRAAEAGLFGRSNRSLSIQFQVSRTAASIVEAEESVFNHWPGLEDSGTLLLRIGAPGEVSKDLLFQNAVLEGVNFPPYLGTVVRPLYLFRAPGVSGVTVTPPTDEMYGGTVAIANGADQVVVNTLALPAPPVRGWARVRKPAGGVDILASIVDGTFAITGFTAELSAATPNANYKLDFGLVL